MALTLNYYEGALNRCSEVERIVTLTMQKGKLADAKRAAQFLRGYSGKWIDNIQDLSNALDDRGYVSWINEERGKYLEELKAFNESAKESLAIIEQLQKA